MCKFTYHIYLHVYIYHHQIFISSNIFPLRFKDRIVKLSCHKDDDDDSNNNNNQNDDDDDN
jgi:hypothetical protein